MSLGTGNRGPRAGAHRAQRPGPPAASTETPNAQAPNAQTAKARASKAPAGEAPNGESKNGPFGVALRSKRTVKRASAVVVLGALVGAGLVHGGAPSPEPTVYQFLLDWEQGQYRQAAALTTGNTTAVAGELAGAYTQLDASGLVLSMNEVRQHGSTATARFNASINLGSIGRQWTYTNSFPLVEVGSAWRVAWSPSVIQAKLTGTNRLAVYLARPGRAQVYASSGQSLLVPSLTYEIGVIPHRLRGGEVTETANRLAAVLGMPAATAGQMAGQIEAAIQNEFRPLVTLPPSQYAKVAKRISAIPGVSVRSARQQLFDSIAPKIVGSVGTETAAVLSQDGLPYRPGTTIGLSGLQQAFQHQLTGTPLTGVIIQTAQGSPLQYLVRWPGLAGKQVTTTLDYGDQEAANAAVAQAPGSVAIVAVQAGTGKVLAVASHQAAGMPALDPLDGQYEPGQAFTVVSSAAILATRQVRPSSSILCKASSEVDNRGFVNVPAEPARMGLTSTFSRDFARGCATAFTGLSELLTGADMGSADAEFGIGAPWQLPLPAFQGDAGQLSGAGDKAAAAVGQGGVLVSPLSMALAAATVSSGSWHAPSLVPGAAGPRVTVKPKMSTQVLSELRELMHATVLRGSGAGADAGSDVYGQAGIASFRAHSALRISWFIGYKGNVAFAVAELVKSPSNAAVPLAGSFLRNIQPGS
jgi:cell division protein FtsI/penicillin-binding protein 2